MEHVKTIKDERGTVRIVVTLSISAYWSNAGFEYRISVSVVPPRKRNERYDNSVATEEEKQQAKLEFWEKIKPLAYSST